LETESSDEESESEEEPIEIIQPETIANQSHLGEHITLKDLSNSEGIEELSNSTQNDLSTMNSEQPPKKSLHEPPKPIESPLVFGPEKPAVLGKRKLEDEGGKRKQKKHKKSKHKKRKTKHKRDKKKHSKK